MVFFTDKFYWNYKVTALSWRAHFMDATPFIGVIELAHLDLASRRIRRREKLASELVHTLPHRAQAM